MKAIIILAVLLTFVPMGWGRTDTLLNQTSEGPGAPGSRFLYFQPPSMDKTGNIGFGATLQFNVGGVVFENSGGLWATGPDGLFSLVARTGTETAPGDTFQFAFLGNGISVVDGLLTFFGQTNDSNSEGGLWGTDQAGIVRLVSKQGDLAPNNAGAIFESHSPALVAASTGGMFFNATLKRGGSVNGSNDNGIWTAIPGGPVSEVLREGNPCPIADSVFGSNNKFTVNASGSALISGKAKAVYHYNVLWSRDPGSGAIAVVAVEGGGAAGTGGADFHAFGTPSINAAGEGVFKATLIQNEFATVNNDEGIWSRTPAGVITLTHREGDVAPEAVGGTFQSFGDPLINGNGDIAFESQLTNWTKAIFGPDAAGSATRFVEAGVTPVPGAEGAAFSSLFSSLYLNDRGNVAFTGYLQSGVGGVTSDTDQGLWIFDHLGGVLVVREGDLIDGKTVQQISSLNGTSGGEDGRASILNDSSQLVYSVRFTDGSWALQKFTPDLHFRPGGGGANQWGNRQKWTLSLLPSEIHDVFVDPDDPVTLIGPAGDASVRSLVVGGGQGLATLAQDGGSLAVNQDLHLLNNGSLSMSGSGRLTVSGSLDVGANASLALAGNAEIHATALATNGVPENLDWQAGFLNLTGADPGGVALTLGSAGPLGASLILGPGKVLGLEGGDLRLETGSTLTMAGGRVALFGHQILADGPATFEFSDGEMAGVSLLSFNLNQQGGTLTIGASPGTMVIDGSYTLGSAGVVEFELGGLSRGQSTDGYDYLDVTGQVSVSGSIKIVFYSGFVPQNGDAFDILDATEILFDGDVMDLFDFSEAPGTWDLSQFASDGVIQFVGTAPEPAPMKPTIALDVETEEVVLGFQTLVGVSYEAFKSPDLAIWTTTGEVRIGDGQSMEIRLPQSLLEEYYRIVSTP